MRLKTNDMTITMSVSQHAQGNGHCNAKVRFKGKLDGSGSYIAGARGVTTKVYRPGAWTKKIGQQPSGAPEPAYVESSCQTLRAGIGSGPEV